MEAATPLNPPRVRTIGDRLAVDGLLIDDETAVRLAHEREDAGDDPARLVTDAIAIGARVLDREQVGANADFVKTEFEKASADLQREFGEQAREVIEQLDAQLGAVFADGDGRLAKELAKHFDDGSTAAVQNRVREMVREVMTKSREEMLQQFSSADGKNPLADFKDATVRSLNKAGELQQEQLRAVVEKMTALELQVQGLRDEKAKLEEIAAVEAKGTAKGRSFEDAVFDALDRIAETQGDDCDAVGDVKGATRKTGDIVVGVDACAGPARARILFEAKHSRLSKPEAMRELDRGMAERDAEYAVLVVSSEDELPARTDGLREYGGDKLFVVYDPEEGSPLALELAYRLARARVLMARDSGDEIDGAAVRDTVEKALGALGDARKIKLQLTGAQTSLSTAAEILGDLESRVKAQLAEIDRLVSAPEA